MELRHLVLSRRVVVSGCSQSRVVHYGWPFSRYKPEPSTCDLHPCVLRETPGSEVHESLSTQSDALPSPPPPPQKGLVVGAVRSRISTPVRQEFERSTSEQGAPSGDMVIWMVKSHQVPFNGNPALATVCFHACVHPSQPWNLNNDSHKESNAPSSPLPLRLYLAACRPHPTPTHMLPDSLVLLLKFGSHGG